MNKEIIIFTGNIGSGKSTLASKFGRMGYVVVNNDLITTMVQGGEYGAYDAKKKDVYKAIEFAGIKQAVASDLSVVVDRTNMKASDRKRYIDLAPTDYRIVSYNFGGVCTDGLDRRIRSPKGVAAQVWYDVHKRMSEAYETPRVTEGFNEVRQPPRRYTFRAVDFDGTICENAFPGIGKPNDKMVSRMREWWADIHNMIIIWTCRSGNYIAEMKAFLIKNNIPFDFINENPLINYGSPKIYADEYYDDRGITVLYDNTHGKA